MKNTTLKSTILAAAGLIFMAGSLAEATSPDSKIVFAGRTDYTSNTYNDDSTTPQTARPPNAAFAIQTFLIDFNGKLGEETGYRVRMNMPKSTGVVGVPGPADNISTFFDYAYITRTLMPDLTLVFGKQWSGVAGTIGVANVEDVYKYPQAFIDMSVNSMIYTTGVGLKYEVAGQKFQLTATDPGASTTDPATSAANNARQAIGARWSGSFMNGALLPAVSYMSEARQNSAASTKNLVNNYMSVGAKYTVPAFDISLDYLANTYADKTTAGLTDLSNSIYFLARYKMAELGLNPFFSFESSAQNTETSATVEKKVTSTGYAVGVEYYPKKDEDFRYHIVYTGQNSNTDLGTGAAATKQVQQTIIAGLKFRADILK